MNFTNPQKKFLLGCFLALVLAVGYSYSQGTTGKIVGKVTDEEGTPFPGVTVEISGPKLLGMRTDITTEKGLYRFVALPPGAYKILFKLDGFNPVERTAYVQIGGTYTVDAVLKAKAIEEEITVVAEAPLIDVNRARTSSSWSDEDLEKIAVSRTSFDDILNTLPGYEADVATLGTDTKENAHVVDGALMDSPEAGWSILSYLKMEMFEEVGLITTGAPAEYGKFSGAVVNIVTKSGGNTTEGSLGFFSQPDFLVGDNNPDPEKYASYESKKWFDITGTLSGAVAKDKLWFFIYGQHMYREYVRWNDDPRYPYKRTDDAFMFKLTGQISPAHKLVGQFRYEFVDRPWWIPTQWVMPESAATDLKYIYTMGADWTWLVNRDMFVNSKIMFVIFPEWYNKPNYGGSLYDAPHFDLYTGILSNAPGSFTFWNNNSLRANTNLTYYAEDFLGGDHEFKIGVQYEKSLCHGAGGYPGNKLYNDWNGQPYLLYVHPPHHYGGFVNGIGGFIDDSLKIGERLTINLGIRFDHIDCDIPSWPLMDGPDDLPEKAPGQDNVISWNVLAPRVGFVFQLTPDHKTILKGFYGRYYDSPHANTYGMPGPGNRDRYHYSWTGTDWDLYDYIPSELGSAMDPNLKNPKVDQFTIGLERELIKDLSVGAQYIYKKQTDLLGPVDRTGIFEEVQRVSPDNGEVYTVYNRVSPSEASEFWMTNPESYEVTYNGLIFSLKKRYSNNWMMNASLVWSKNKGLSMASASEGAAPYFVWWGGNFGRDPNDWINGYGYYPYDRKWVFKAQVAYNLPFGILVSANYQYRTGRPYRTMVRILDLNQGMVTIFDEPRGRRRFDSEHYLDIRLEKTFNVYETLEFSITVDIFNALKEDAINTFQSYNLFSSAYLFPGSVASPRIGQIGVRLRF